MILTLVIPSTECRSKSDPTNRVRAKSNHQPTWMNRKAKLGSNQWPLDRMISTLVIPSTLYRVLVQKWNYPIGFKPKAIINLHEWIEAQLGSDWWPLDLQSNALPLSYGPILHDFNLSDLFYRVSVQKWPYPIGFGPKAIINFPTRFQLVTTWSAIKCPTTELWTHFFVWFQRPTTELWTHFLNDFNLSEPFRFQLKFTTEQWTHFIFCMISTLVISSTECRSKSDPRGSSQKQSSTNMYE